MSSVSPKNDTSVLSKTFTSYQKIIIFLLAILQFTIVLDFMILAPLGDILMKSMNMSTKQFGTVVSAYAISACISGIFAAGFADKFDRKKLLLFFYAGFILGTYFCAISYNYETLFIARIITGLFGGVIGSISMAIITDIFSIHQRGKVMGFVQMAFGGSQILGIPIGLVLANYWSWHATFYMVLILAFILGIALVIKLKPLTEHLKLINNKNALQHLLQTIKKKDYRIGFLATALLSMGGFMIMPFSTAFIVNNIHIAQSQVAIIFFFTGIFSIIIMPIVGKLSDKYDKLMIFGIGTIIAIVMVVIYTHLSPVPIWLVIIVNIVLFIGIMSRMVPATALNSAVPDAYDRGAYMSINSSLQQFAGGIAALFSGLVVVQKSKNSPIENFDVLGYVMVVLMLLCFYFVFKVNVLLKKREIK
jgi:predicted MFS family arabinose efflux permease